MDEKEQLIEEINDLRIQLDNEGLSEREFETLMQLDVYDLEREKENTKRRLISELV